MDDFLQHFGTLGRLILKILFVLVVLRILIFALGLKIVEYIPVIDDLITVLQFTLRSLSLWGEKVLNGLVKM